MIAERHPEDTSRVWRRMTVAIRSLAARYSRGFALQPGHQEFLPRSSRTWLISLACDWSAVFQQPWWQ